MWAVETLSTGVIVLRWLTHVMLKGTRHKEGNVLHRSPWWETKCQPVLERPKAGMPMDRCCNISSRNNLKQGSPQTPGSSHCTSSHLMLLKKGREMKNCLLKCWYWERTLLWEKVKACLTVHATSVPVSTVSWTMIQAARMLTHLVNTREDYILSVYTRPPLVW